MCALCYLHALLFSVKLKLFLLFSLLLLCGIFYMVPSGSGGLVSFGQYLLYPYVAFTHWNPSGSVTPSKCNLLVPTSHSLVKPVAAPVDSSISSEYFITLETKFLANKIAVFSYGKPVVAVSVCHVEFSGVRAHLHRSRLAEVVVVVAVHKLFG